MLYLPCSSVIVPVIRAESCVSTEIVTNGIASPRESVTVPVMVC